MDFNYYKDQSEISESVDSILVEIPKKINKKKDLLEFYNKSLNFPYFGFNWDSLDELLNSLDWIKKKNIYIIHNDVPLISDQKAKRVYLDILMQAVDFWKDEVEHDFHVYFPISSKGVLLD